MLVALTARTATVDRLGRYLRSFAAVVLGLVVLSVATGCAIPSTLRSEVTAFHRWEDQSPRSYAFVRDPARSQSLEHRSYEDLVAQRLAALGFVPAEPSSARFRVAFEYRATPEPHRFTEFWFPGAIGPGFPMTPWIGPRTFSGHPYGRMDPLWSMPPVPITQETTVWRHTLRVDLFDQREAPEPGRKVWEATAVGVARSEAFPRLMPGLIQAVFTDFPGPSGVTRQVEVPLTEAIR